jgi:endonuclease/exonuclease/phosphatase family metal-dependent hydrolase
MDTIFDADADVVVLNEYHWNDYRSTHKCFEERLLNNGYRTYYCGRANATPTFIASKCPVLQYTEVVLSMDRSALCIKVVPATTGTQPMWIIGTHLDAFDGRQRNKEMRLLLDCLDNHHDHRDDASPSLLLDGHSAAVPVVMMGDFNQQRQQDYTTDEWNRIRESMDRRNVCHDDGVSTMLRDHNFTCVFDQIQYQPQQPQEKLEMTTEIKQNWEDGPSSLPPSTHWSGTTIDYHYARNVPVHGVYVSPAGYSDHRMTVCDWIIVPQSSSVVVSSSSSSSSSPCGPATVMTDSSTSRTSTCFSTTGNITGIIGTTTATTSAVIVDDNYCDMNYDNDDDDNSGFSSSSSV